jgi:DNA-binding beta-propeller fold protein YncE
VYAASNGNLAREIPGRFPDLSYNKLAVDPANNLYAINDVSPFEDLIKLDADGNVMWEKSNFLEPIINKNKPFNVADMAVDGLGNLFILNSSGYEIYRFDPQGNFVDRFGSQGEEPQQFSNPSSLAIDGKGRLFVFDSNNGYWLKVFDPSGTYLESLAWPDELTYPRMILFDAQGKLYTVTNTNQVGRMKLSE